MKAWREHVFFGRLCQTFLVQTCEGQREKNNQGVLTDCSKFQKRDKVERQYGGNF